MTSPWSDAEAVNLGKSTGITEPEFGPLLHASRLLGADPDMAMHGGGNTSLKASMSLLSGERRDVLYVKASGADMASAAADTFVALDLEYLRRLAALKGLSDEQMDDEFRLHMLARSELRPSIEALMHAFVPARVVLHAHPAATLALTNRTDGAVFAARAIPKATIIPYARVGFDLATAVAAAYAKNPGSAGIIIANHGAVTWGDSAKSAYEKMIVLVRAADAFLAAAKKRPITGVSVSIDEANSRYARLAPLFRGLLSPRTENPDRPFAPAICAPLIDPEVLRIIHSPQGRECALSQPLTPDYLIRTRRLPVWIDAPKFDDEAALREQLVRAIAEYGAEYRAFTRRFSPDAQPDPMPRALALPGLGVVCAGPDAHAAAMVRDIMRQSLLAKARIFETGDAFCGIGDEHLFDMEFRGFQRAKLGGSSREPLRGTIALVTGAAGAIGSGVCRALCAAGCHLAVTDLAGPTLDAAAQELSALYPGRIVGVPLDVTDPASVAAGFSRCAQAFGGLDLLIVNAGIAHVSPLADLSLEDFRKLERVNIDGTLLLLAGAGRLFRRQNTGGDIVLISTKNVFAPGAGFGAYSATKAAAHQLARIASLEMAAMDVRVNMVSPDAVFSDGSKKSGLWATVGPDRMRARGLDEKGLEEYYRSRNLLKMRVTADHVANAVLFFAARQTPTTGATIPVDGGLPDATPR